MNPNRLAALSGVLAAVVGALVSLLGAVDTYEKAIVLSVALLVVGAVLIVWLIGWQKHEAAAADPYRLVSPLPSEQPAQEAPR